MNCAHPFTFNWMGRKNDEKEEEECEGKKFAQRFLNSETTREVEKGKELTYLLT